NIQPDGRVYRPLFIGQERNGSSNVITNFRGEFRILPNNVDVDTDIAKFYFSAAGLLMLGGGNPSRQVAPLEVWASTSNTSAIMIGGNASSDPSTDASLGFYAYNTAANRPEYASVGMDVMSAEYTNQDGALVFKTITHGSLTEKMRLGEGGILAVGTN